MKTILKTEFLILARGLLEQRDVAAALDCATKAVRLEPGAADVAAFLREAVRKPPGAPLDPAQHAHLTSRKRQVEALLAADPCWRMRLGLDEPLLPPAAPNATLPTASDELQLRTRLDRLKQRLTRHRNSIKTELRERLQALLERLVREETLASGGPGPAAVGPPPDDSVYDDLSLEHQFHNIGNDFYKILRFDDAIACYGLALELRPDLLETFFNRALAQTRLGRYSAAAGDLHKVIELNPNLAEAFYTLGLVEEYRLEFDAAIQNHEKAIAIDPNYTRARTQIDVVRRKQKESAGSGSVRAGGSGASLTAATDKEGRILDYSSYRVRPDVRFADVCNRQARQILELVAGFLRGEKAFDEWGADPPRGIIMFGPPGTGKTLLAQALAGEVGCPFYCIPATVFMNLWFGSTEQNLRRCWEQVSSHTEGAVLFLDEFQTVGSRRSDPDQSEGGRCYDVMVGCLLDLMGGFRENPNRLVVLAATNALSSVDPALLRSGRFDYKLEVAAPTPAEAGQILKIHLRKAEARAHRIDFLDASLRAWVRRPNLDSDELDEGEIDAPESLRPFLRLAHRHGFVGADLREVVRRTVFERAAHQVRRQPDPGPICASDLRRHIEALTAEKRPGKAGASRRSAGRLTALN